MCDNREVQTEEFLRKQSDTVASQVAAVLDGMPSEHLDGKLTPHAMSPRETIVHLCDCACALKAMLKEGKYSWGSYEARAADMPALVEEWKSLRAEALAEAFADGSDKALGEISDFIVLHDAYHVGQLAAYRLATDPAWDAYAIYG